MSNINRNRRKALVEANQTEWILSSRADRPTAVLHITHHINRASNIIPPPQKKTLLLHYRNRKH